MTLAEIESRFADTGRRHATARGRITVACALCGGPIGRVSIVHGEHAVVHVRCWLRQRQERRGGGLPRSSV